MDAAVWGGEKLDGVDAAAWGGEKLDGVDAAVDEEFDAGDVAGVSGGEEDGGFGDVVAGANAAAGTMLMMKLATSGLASASALPAVRMGPG